MRSLARVGHQLRCYQGEDTSLGAWLATVEVTNFDKCTGPDVFQLTATAGKLALKSVLSGT